MLTPDDIDLFHLWLEKSGATILPCKSQWEVLRWKHGDHPHVMYRNAKGKVSWSSGSAEEIWDEFCADEAVEVQPAVRPSLSAPTAAFVLLPEAKVGTYSGADLHTADDRWIATVHRTGLNDRINDDFEAIARLLAAAPLTLTLLTKAHKALQDAGVAEDLQYLIYKHIKQLENP